MKRRRLSLNQLAPATCVPSPRAHVPRMPPSPHGRQITTGFQAPGRGAAFVQKIVREQSEAPRKKPSSMRAKNPSGSNLFGAVEAIPRVRRAQHPALSFRLICGLYLKLARRVLANRVRFLRYIPKTVKARRTLLFEMESFFIARYAAV